MDYHANGFLLFIASYSPCGKMAFASNNACTGEARFMIPGGGVPTLDAPRQPFRDPLCCPPAKDVLVKTAYHINDPRFAQIVIEQFRSVTGVPNEFLPRALSTEKFFNPKKGPEN
ncbi:hypothetical protein [Serratia liquefaciens]|uniref:hypothetical protein n=1 Tax=Serratia liquefaciens TaxID=614 RepID=UPI003B43688E